MIEFCEGKMYFFVGYSPMRYVERDVTGGFVFHVFIRRYKFSFCLAPTRPAGLKVFNLIEVEALVEEPKPMPEPEPEPFAWVLKDFGSGVKASLWTVAVLSGVVTVWFLLFWR